MHRKRWAVLFSSFCSHLDTCHLNMQAAFMLIIAWSIFARH